MQRILKIGILCAMVCALMSAQTIVVKEPRLQPMVQVTDTIVQQLLNQMVWVRGGMLHFDSKGDASVLNEGAVLSVVVGDYYIGSCEVTQEQWEAVMGGNPSKTKGIGRPVENISYDECVYFTKCLSRLTGIPFDLPTENQWVYAERGGMKSRRYSFSGSDSLGDETNYDNKIHNIGERKPNELGLFDMTGNVWEYCRDWWHESQIKDRYDVEGSPSVVEGEIVRVYVIRRGRLARKIFVDSTTRRSDTGFRLSVSL